MFGLDLNLFHKFHSDAVRSAPDDFGRDFDLFLLLGERNGQGHYLSDIEGFCRFDKHTADADVPADTAVGNVFNREMNGIFVGLSTDCSFTEIVGGRLISFQLL